MLVELQTSTGGDNFTIYHDHKFAPFYFSFHIPQLDEHHFVPYHNQMIINSSFIMKIISRPAKCFDLSLPFSFS